MRYTGRFAPSPTGSLHFGSLVAATASYLDARAANGAWLVRMEDLDTPRCVPGAADDILRTLEGFGFEWDGEVLYQSERTDLYVEALQQLREEGRAYPCACSRKEAGEIYPGTCRDGVLPGRTARSWRFRVNAGTVCFEDRVQGRICSDLPEECGDFILRRADGLFAYQLAVVVDDALQGVTDIVRGADLLDSTPRQIALQRGLGYPEPRYLHTPVAVNAEGQKLSKQTLAPRVDARNGTHALRPALEFLGQTPPPTSDLREFWKLAITAWNPVRIAREVAV